MAETAPEAEAVAQAAHNRAPSHGVGSVGSFDSFDIGDEDNSGAADCADPGKAKKVERDPMDPDFDWVETRTTKQQWLEYGLMCLANIAWTIDCSILPMFFIEFQNEFGVSQTSLSMLSTAKGWAFAAFAFPCGFIGEMLPRPLLVGLGMIFWAFGLGMCSMAPNFEMLFVGRVLNGVGLGITQPLLLSLVSDTTQPTRRGSTIGSLYFVGAVCNTIFGVFATSNADVKIAGLMGWRFSVLLIGIFSGLVGLAFLLLVKEPNAEALVEKRKQYTYFSVFTKNLPKVKQLFKVPTFVLILCQGAPGTAPWTVFPFFTQWLELSCFTHEQAAWIFSAFNWGNAFSNLLSGFLLNFVAVRYPDHGPPTIANFSVAIGIPFLVLFFFVLPKPAALGEGAGDVPVYFLTFLAFGLLAAMCGTLNKKVFGDIVPAEIYTYVFAMDQFIEQGLGNFASLAVGVVTEKVFKYDAEVATQGECAPEEAAKLGMGMFAVCNVAWAICFVVYLGMHCTYPKDRQRQLQMRRDRAMAIKNAA